MYITDVIERPIPCKQLLHVPACQDTGWVYNVTHMYACTCTLALLTTTIFISFWLVTLLGFFLKSIVKALSVIPVGVFGYCHKHKRIILALWFCRNPSCGYSTELRGRTAKHNSHLSCLLSCIYMPPMPYQVAGLLLCPPPSVCLT